MADAIIAVSAAAAWILGAPELAIGWAVAAVIGLLWYAVLTATRRPGDVIAVAIGLIVFALALPPEARTLADAVYRLSWIMIAVMGGFMIGRGGRQHG